MKIVCDDFTFEGLWKPAGCKETAQVHLDCMCYLVGIVDSPKHPISNPLSAKRILSWLYEVEEQAENADHLRATESFFSRYFPGGYQVVTPCIVVERWSPISAMLDRGLQPTVLNREEKFHAVATGIWDAVLNLGALEIGTARTSEELFWAVLQVASTKAATQGMWVSIISRHGWSYRHAIGSLPDWPQAEVAKAGRILWKRTPEG